MMTTASSPGREYKENELRSLVDDTRLSWQEALADLRHATTYMQMRRCQVQADFARKLYLAALSTLSDQIMPH